MRPGILITALLSTVFCVGGGSYAADPPPQVRVVTPMGAITLELDPINAPVTTANFLRYVDEAFYNGGQFFRTVTEENQPFDTVKIAVIQGRADAARAGDAYPPIALERTSDTGLTHLDGTVSMARSEPDTATDSFFICVGDQPELDYGGGRNPDGQGFAAFGHVVDGIEVVRTINALPAAGQSLDPPVLIEQVVRVN
jgi:peptidyl-prolyl cis-trans isomerase A (cyclophilin A)